MPVYDYRCDACNVEYVDQYTPKVTQERPCPKCGATCYNLIRPSGVIGDEIDIWIRHGLCHEDGSPKHFTSKQEIRREAERKGLTNKVQHLGTKSGDKSRHTTRWT